MPELDQQTIWIILAVVAVLVLAVVVGVALKRRAERNRRKAALRERYGPEYDRAVHDMGSERHAVEDLAQREERHDTLQLRDLDDADRNRVRTHMAVLQFRFVDEPADVLLETQRVVTEVLRVMGYPVVTDRAEGLRMLSVDHPLQTQPVRALLQGEYGNDLNQQRDLFLDVRTALRDVADISYTEVDAGSARELAVAGAVPSPGGPPPTEPLEAPTTPGQSVRDESFRDDIPASAASDGAGSPALPADAAGSRGGATAVGDDDGNSAATPVDRDGDGSKPAATQLAADPGDTDRQHEANPT